MPLAPQEIIDLVAAFRLNQRIYTSSAYNEAQVRAEFIDKFFTCLGWDISNRANNAPQYREVITESLIQSGAGTPDYTFRIGPEVVFFVEAKKPQVDVGADVNAAFQLRKYAWNARLKTSILTDFHEFAVYDCQMKPTVGARAGDARVLYLTYDQYPDLWDEIAAKFSRDAVLKGGYDAWASANTGKKGTQTVDAAFLADMSAWRELLAHNLALRNPTLSDSALNYAVQMTLDRIVFWRICEDRGLEPFEQLLRTTQGKDIYPRLLDLFRLADQRYNSGLFHFTSEKGRESPDALTPTLRFDDAVLKEIIGKLYWPAPYDFNQMPVEILGRVYEQFLGSVIRLTPSHQAKIEEKPEVRKAGGVYYTPQYIVRYIVEHTVGELLKDKTPADVVDLAICDPACGSGSFLLGAYEHLLAWYLDWYTTHPARQPRKEVYQGKNGWQLTVAEKKRILLAHIYGVDIDQQAVEVTKLSLLLKVLEGENQGSVQQLQLLRDRVLPDMGNNILCGNSLIGWDYPGAASLSSDDLRRINPFDWQQAFPRVYARGGFDAVIGNPPWGASFTEQEIVYLKSTYVSAKVSILDSYALFIEKAIHNLKSAGLLGYITPDTFLRKDNYQALRHLLLKNYSLLEIIETGPLFSKVRDTWCTVITIQNQKPNADTIIKRKQISRFVVSVEDRLDKFATGHWDIDSFIHQTQLQDSQLMIIGYHCSDFHQSIVSKMEKHERLGTLHSYHISRGEEGSKYNVVESLGGEYFMVIPKNVERYCVEQGIPVSSKSLTLSKIKLIYSHPKIWVIRIQKMRWKQRIVSGYDDRTNSSAMKTLQSVVSDSSSGTELRFLLGILASRLVNFWCINYLADDMNQSYLERIPIAIPEINSADVARHDQMVQLVERMLQLHKDLATAATPHDRELLTRQIAATDVAIDRLVYELYDLTPDEVTLVEAGG